MVHGQALRVTAQEAQRQQPEAQSATMAQRELNMTKLILFALALGIGGCSAANSAPEPSEAKPEVAESAPPAAVPAEGAVRIRIEGFECGDNCYLDYKILAPAEGDAPVGEAQSALCSVDACEDWFVQQAMPDGLVGRSATITLGKGSQYDNAGNEMSSDFPEITAITVDPAE